MITLYIHIPFCAQKCFYCSFVISVGQEQRMDAYLDCLQKEAQKYKGAEVQSVYIGGGTPTLMSTDQLRRLFCMISNNFRISSGSEWTIEANPEKLEQSKLTLLKQEGITRISLGVQSLNDRYLKYLGRNHDVRTAIKAFQRIRESGFDNINVDLMFAFPDQTTEELKKDVNAVLQLNSDHLSLYTLTIEEHSRFFTRNIQLKDGQDQAQQYELVCHMLDAAGFKQYEVSNFSKGLKMSQHNVHYWQGGEYIGLGIGAHSYIRAKRFWNVSKLNDYIARMQDNDSVEAGHEMLTPFDQMKEAILFGLRMNTGVHIKQIEDRFGCSFNKDQQQKVEEFIRGGFLSQDKGYLKINMKGRLVLDELCAQLI